MKLTLGTRGSSLARAQARRVADALTGAANARGIDLDTELHIVTTHGDVTAGPLATMSEVGVFVSALREAVLAGECDLAVHSLKDMPVAAHEELVIGAFLERDDPRDVWCSGGLTWEEIPAGSIVGTSSPRRAAQLTALRPDLVTADIRGNVDSRLAKVGEDYDAIVLAAAGLQRLDRLDDATAFFDVTQMLPAPGQAVIAVEHRPGDDVVGDLLVDIDDGPTRYAVTAERAVLGAVLGGCAVPMGAYATVSGRQLALTARVTSPDGLLTLTETVRGEATHAAAIGHSAGLALLGRGAAQVMGRAR